MGESRTLSLTRDVYLNQYATHRRRGIQNSITNNANVAYAPEDAFHPQRPPDLSARTVDDVMNSEAQRSALGAINQIATNFRHRRYVWSQNSQNPPFIMQQRNPMTQKALNPSYFLNYDRSSGNDHASWDYGPENYGWYTGHAANGQMSKTQTHPFVLNFRYLKSPYNNDGYHVNLAGQDTHGWGKTRYVARKPR